MNLKNKENNKERIFKLILSSILAGLSILIGMFEIPMTFLAPWLKLDFSEVVILISLLILGYFRTIGVIITRSIVRWFIPIQTQTNIPFPFYGELIAILASIIIISFYELAKIILKDNDIDNFKHNKKVILKDIIKIVFITLGLTLFMTLINYFITTPALLSAGEHLFFTSYVNSGGHFLSYGTGYKAYTIGIISIYVPFNIIKGLSIGIIYTILKRPIITSLNLKSSKRNNDITPN